MKLYLVTGTTRGLGEALALRLLSAGAEVVSLSRSRNPKLERPRHRHVDADLTEPARAAEALERHLKGLDSSGVEETVLIHNAAVSEPLALVQDSDPAAWARAMTVNAAAPQALSAAFVRATAGWKCFRAVCFISSGAASFPLRGMSAYCASKAALEMLAKTFHAEQRGAKQPVACWTVQPGIFETRMQESARSADIPERGRFAGYHDEGRLADPAQVAAEIAAALASRRIPDGGTYSCGR